jgi:DNA-binding IclR family transcriptional regulator
MSFKVAGLLEILSDGEWHTLEGVQRKTKLSRNHVQQVAAFLEEYEFVTLDETRKKIRVKEAVRRFLTHEITS